MQVGILTFHDGINYGAFFQVYALQSFLLQHGFDCQVINYKSIGFTKREYKVFLKPRRPIYSMRNIRKIIRFRKAQKKLCLTKRIFKQKKLSKLTFDRIIIGSDEVWNFKSRSIGYDLTYFSQGLKADHIISYAASFGSINADDAIPFELKECLNRIDCISVRDENSANIMRALSKKRIQIVLDPVFLIDLSAEAITAPEEGFILVYGAFTKQMIHHIIEYARLVGKKIVSVCYNFPWCDINLDTLGPFQWLGYFASCDCVITTMFHGMICSILNRKQFCMFSTPYRKNKVGNLLSDLELSNRMIAGDRSVKDVFAEQIDYTKVNTRIEAKRCQSEKFLLDALQS